MTRRPQSAPIRNAPFDKRVGSDSERSTAVFKPITPWTVSRTIELSLQSTFQLSLTVLVYYRARVDNRLALEGFYLPIHVALPSNATLGNTSTRSTTITWSHEAPYTGLPPSRVAPHSSGLSGRAGCVHQSLPIRYIPPCRWATEVQR